MGNTSYLTIEFDDEDIDVGMAYEAINTLKKEQLPWIRAVFTH